MSEDNLTDNQSAQQSEAMLAGLERARNEAESPVLASAQRQSVVLGASTAVLALVTFGGSIAALTVFSGEYRFVGSVLWVAALCLAPVLAICAVLTHLAIRRWRLRQAIVDLLHMYEEQSQRTSQSLFQQKTITPDEWGQQERQALARATAWPSMMILAMSVIPLVIIGIWTWPAGTVTSSLVPFGIFYVVLAVVGVGIATSVRRLGDERFCGAKPLAAALHAAARMLLVVGAGAVLSGMGLQATGIVLWLWYLLAAFAVCIILEHLFRVGLHILAPVQDHAQVQPYPPLSSALAGSVLIGVERSAVLSLRDHFGIDLGANWGVRFLRRAALPLATVVAAIAWLITGVTLLQPNQRGIYERLGVAQDHVLGPGLHVHLPWPFGRVQHVEFGTVHRVTVSLVAPDADAEISPLTAAEAPASARDHRLWSEAHGDELLYLCANRRRLQTEGEDLTRAVRPFELFAVDLSVHFRAGLSDRQAHDFTYRAGDHNVLVRTFAREILQSFLVNMAAEELLAADRAALGNALHNALVDRLDGIRSGVEVLAVTLEAIHPPRQTARAFDLVQTADESVAALLTAGRSRGETTVIAAQGEIRRIAADASASSIEARARARSQRARFETDTQSAAVGRDAFRLERFLQAWQAGLTGKPLTIIDQASMISEDGNMLPGLITIPAQEAP